MPNLKKNHLPFVMWLIPLLFFTYQFVLRLWPGLMIHQIMEQFGIDASHFGLLAALYYYGYAGMQIPVAIMLERYQVRYIVFVFAFLCGLATFTFTFTNNWYLACLSRFLIGAGSAVGFLSVSKVISEWFPKNKYAGMIGFSFSIGLLGAVYGGKPISLLVAHYSWQNVAFVLSCIAVLIGLNAYFFLRTPQKNDSQRLPAFKLSYFKMLLTSPLMWLLATANFLMVGCLEGFADIWGVPYLKTAYHLTTADAAQLISFIFLGMLVGGPFLAFLSKKLGNYLVISFSGIVMAFAFFLLLFANQYNWYYFASLLFLIGMMCCYQVIVFAAGAELVSAQLMGVTVAFLNCINMLGGSFFHTLIGYAMDKFWTGLFNDDGLKQYTLSSYKASLAIIPYCTLLGSCLIGLLSFLLYYKRKYKTDILLEIN